VIQNQFDPQAKLLWHHTKISALLNGQHVWPLMAELDPASHCNQACQWCSFIPVHTFGLLSKQVLTRLIEDFRDVGLRSINWTGGGEPTLNPYLGEALVLAKSYGIENGLYSNGQKLSEALCRDIVDSNVWFRLSLDAGNEVTYAELHRTKPAVFNHVLSMLRYMVDYRNESASAITLGAGMLVCRENVDEIVDSAERCKELGIDYFQIKPVVDSIFHDEGDPGEDRAWWRHVVMPKLEEVQRLSDDTYKVLVTSYKFEDIISLTRYNRGYRRCLATPLIATIQGDGEVVACCHTRGLPKYSLGNLNERGFKDIWQDQHHWDLIKTIGHKSVCGESATDFKDCQINCKPHEMNKMLWHMANPDESKHPNFI
jgi:MoaA/NifB/PqqE/SkfB family radical SAM enzyme